MSSLKRNKALLLSLILIFLTACDGLEDVNLDPQVVSFTASPSSIQTGESSTLSWNILGGPEDLPVTLTPGDVELEKTGEYTVTPSETTLYTLTAGSADEAVSKEFTVTVGAWEGETPSSACIDPETTPEDCEGEVIFEGSATITTQEDIDALAGVTFITGGLNIETDAQTLDFSPLDSLKLLGEFDLSIDGNPNLTSVAGFPNLERADISIGNNASLETVSGFEKLREANTGPNGGFIVSGNSELVSLPDFDALEESFIVRFQDNPKLAALPNFASLETTQVDSSGIAVNIDNNDALTDINGFESWNDGVTTLYITDNDALTTISGFSGLNEANTLVFSENPRLETISGFNSLDSTNRLTLSALPALNAISGFDALSSIMVRLIIEDGVGLGNYEAFNGVTIGDLEITGVGFTQLSGFDTAEVDRVFVQSNPGLETISGFNDATLPFVLAIEENAALTTLSGFANVPSSSDTVYTILNNESFDCSIPPQSELSFLPVFESSGNLVDCPVIGDSDPEPSPEDGVVVGNVRITNQAELDALEGVTRIEGSLRIKTDAETLDFSPLDDLETVTVGLAFSQNNLDVIEGFPSLERVGPVDFSLGEGYLTFESNDARLTDIRGFESLKYVGELQIVSNDSLENVSGFNALEEGGIEIRFNESVETLPNFESLITDGVYEAGIQFARNDNLSSFPSFDSLKEVTRLNISSNRSLTSIVGFENLEIITEPLGDIYEALDISNNSALVSITGFNKLVTAAQIILEGNSSLTTLDGFDSREDGEGITISDNDVFDCAVEPQANLPFLPVGSSTGNLIDCPTQ